jgi:hypothetical protein
MNQSLPAERLDKFFRSFKPQYVLGTTYTLSLAFFESVIFRDKTISKSDLRKCLVLCDTLGYQRAMAEATALRSATRDYLVATAPHSSSVHAKVWLMVNDQQLAILVGSGNLTRSGFIDNLELFESLHFKAGGPGRRFGEAVKRFVAGMRGLWRNIDSSSLLVIETLKEIEHAIDGVVGTLVPEPDDSPWFWSSFEQNTAIDAMRSFAPCRKVSVAAPYFGHSVEGLKLVRDACAPEELQVYPAVHYQNAIDIPAAELKKLSKTSLALLQLTENTNAFAHLKLYGLETQSGKNWLFTTSANCTVAALTNKNIEAGVWRPVAPQMLAAYFQPSTSVVPESLTQLDSSAAGNGWITMWATDCGPFVELIVSEQAQNRLPLREVEVALLIGGGRRTTKRKALFENLRTDRISWGDFGEIRQTAFARALEVSGIEKNGKELRVLVLVDDLVELTAEPAQRSAWRAARTILGTEGVPEFGDIAALMQLASEVAADQETASEMTTSAREPSGSTEAVRRDKIAIWPPQPVMLDFSHYQSSGSGHIYWFDRILAAFANPSARTVANSVKPSDATSNESDRGDEDEEELPQQQINACDRLWKRAKDALDTLARRLSMLELSDRRKHRVWGPSLVVFLSVLAVKRAVLRATKEQCEVPRTSDLAEQYIRLMFLDRVPPEDFDARSESPYFEMGTFPPLATDLADRLSVHPQLQLCPMLLLTFAHFHAVNSRRADSPSLTVAWLRFRETAGDFFEEACLDHVHLRQLWAHFFEEDRQEFAGKTWRCLCSKCGT